MGDLRHTAALHSVAKTPKEVFEMRQYLNLLNKILKEGSSRKDRTGVGCRSLFGEQLKFFLGNNILPVITTKKIHLKSVIHELIWMISGDTNIRYLNDNDVHIWDDWADKNGDFGPIYGAQWRGYNSAKYYDSTYSRDFPDQLANVIKSLKEDPFSRRHIVNSWNVLDLDNMALPPCHIMFQFFVEPDAFGKPRGLLCHMYQRSADAFLGLPFNITSYALLTHMVAKVCGYIPRELIISLGDVHIYKNHIEQVREQLIRTPNESPTHLKFRKKEYSSIDDFKYNDIIIEDYDSWPSIKGEIAV